MLKDYLTQEQLNRDYTKIKEIALKLAKQGEFREALNIIKALASIMSSFNIIYCDDDLEEILINMSSKIFYNSGLGKTKYHNEKKIVFYDYFSLDNRGLSYIYIKALVKLGYEIMYITYERNATANMKLINEELQKSNKSKIYKIHESDVIKATIELRNVISDFEPSKALIHTTVNDVVGMLAFISFKGEIERFLINITDDAFWLGKSAVDYIIEFRTYGYNVSLKYRGINKEKLMILPYYPVQNMKIEFQEFPFNATHKKVIFSGGALYKIYGSDVFLDSVKYILDNHNDVIFLYAGNGDSSYLRNFIMKNNLNDRFYYVTERKDITQIFKHCYLYLGTYPISGGLMTQLAVVNGKVPVGFNDVNLPCNDLEGLFINNENIKFTYYDLEKFHNEIDRLIDDKTYLSKRESELLNLIISENDFATNLHKSLIKHSTEFKGEDINIDIGYFSNIYFNIENKYWKRYHKLIALSKSSRVFMSFPILFIAGALEIILDKYKQKGK